MTILDQFRKGVESHLRRSGMSPTEFGKAAMNDSDFVHALRRGRNPTLATIEKVKDWMAKNPPAKKGRAA